MWSVSGVPIASWCAQIVSAFEEVRFGDTNPVRHLECINRTLKADRLLLQALDR